MERYRPPRRGKVRPPHKWESSIWGGEPGPVVGFMSVEFQQLIPRQKSPITGFVPIEAFARTARHESEQLWEAVEDYFIRFESIWDPTKYIVKPMLEPRPVAQNIFEFCGRFYVEPGTPSGQTYDFLKDGCLCSSNEEQIVQRLDPVEVWDRGGYWEVLVIGCNDWIAVHRQ